MDGTVVFVGALDGLELPAAAASRVVRCGSPAEALLRLGGGEVCAVVAVGLPGMDGLRLLNRLRSDHPALARIVVDPARGAVFRLRHAELAHQVLPAGQPPALLWAAVQRTLDLQGLLADERLRAVIGGVDGLPGLPPVFVELNRVIGSATCGASEIAAVVARDPALAAKLLQLVNSSFFGLPRRVSAIDEAVAYLGVTTLRALVLSSEAFSLFHPPAAVAVDLAELAARSAAIARAAAALAGRDQRDDAFAAGLLCDLGTVLLATKAPELFGCDETVLGFTHADAGAYLLGLWGLPAPVVDAVASHHRPPDDPGRSGLSAVDAVRRAVTDAESAPAPLATTSVS